MKTWQRRLPAVLAVIGVFCGSAVWAEDRIDRLPKVSLRQPGSVAAGRVDRTASATLQRDDEKPAEPALPGDAAKPMDPAPAADPAAPAKPLDPVPPAKAAPLTTAEPAEPLAPAEPAKTLPHTGPLGPAKPLRPSPFQDDPPQPPPVPDEAYGRSGLKPFAPLTGPATAGHLPCGAAACDPDCGECAVCCEPCRPGLFGFTFNGWLEQGITGADRGAADRFNGPLGFNDREGEYQLNQFYLYAERLTQTCGSGWDIGGRVDLLYGTDWRFAQSTGLETRWNESERFYGLALPQLYMDLAYNNFTLRAGHFYTITGYEVVPAPNNFFYSHSYTFLYGEPFTHTGLLGMYKLGDTVKVTAGIDRGWNNWEDNNGKLEFIFGATWTSCDERTSLGFAMTNGAYDDAGRLNRTMYSLVFTRKMTDQVTYVFQHDLGLDNDGGVAGPNGARQDAYWYGICQYLTYAINERWDMGLRFEWFRDDAGTRVGGIGSPHGWELGPNIPANQIGWAGNFYELTAGFHWKPRDWFILRPECRWDWYSGPPDANGQLPYTAGQRRDQFTYGTDLIVRF